MKIDPKYLEEYKKAASFERVHRKLFIPLLILAFLLGPTGAILSSIYLNGFLTVLLSIAALVLPLATIFSFCFVQNITYKKKKALEKELFDSKMLAEDILTFGKENGIDLFLIALRARCFHELGLIHVPEWCERNSELPTKKD